jgi:hypothetical protein
MWQSLSNDKQAKEENEENLRAEVAGVKLRLAAGRRDADVGDPRCRVRGLL